MNHSNIHKFAKIIVGNMNVFSYCRYRMKKRHLGSGKTKPSMQYSAPSSRMSHRKIDTLVIIFI